MPDQRLPKGWTSRLPLVGGEPFGLSYDVSLPKDMDAMFVVINEGRGYAMTSTQAFAYPLLAHQLYVRDVARMLRGFPAIREVLVVPYASAEIITIATSHEQDALVGRHPRRRTK